MNTSAITVTSLLLVSGTGLAQQRIQAAPVTAPIRDAGTYHAASGSWTRGTDSHAHFGPNTIYNNDINTGQYGQMGGGQEWTDNGRIPSTGGHGNAASDVYTVNGFSYAYCSSEGPSGTVLALELYELSFPCSDPTVAAPDFAITLLAPGSGAVGALSCWTITIDLMGTPDVFSLQGDGEGTFDGVASQDHFAWTNSLSDVGGTEIPAGPQGPLLNGDPNNFPFGDGTYFQNPTGQGTGLGTFDQFWLNDRTGLIPPGCYWFGGIPNGNPYSSFHLQVFAESGDEPGDCPKFCVSNPNSSGGPALIASTDICDQDGDGMIDVQATPVPNQPGIFFTGRNQIDLPFGNGHLCTGGDIVRHGVVFGSAFTATDTIDISGQTGPRRMQYWFRDPLAGGAAYNTSDAMTVLP